MKRYSYREALFVFCGLLLWFGRVSLERLASGDEGFYLYAASLITQGKTPYIDFFYPQAPLLPYIYAFAFHIGGESWESGRLFASIFPAISGAMIYLLLIPSVRRMGALLGVLFFATSVFIFPWLPTAQTYGPSITFLLISLFFVTREKFSLRSIFSCGLFLGLTVDVRIFFIGLLPFFLGYLWIRSEHSFEKFKRFAFFFLLGLGLALLPHLFFFLLDPQAYWFNNLGYHLTRSGRTVGESLEHKFQVAQVLSGLRPSQKFGGYQFALFFWGWGLVGIVSLVTRKAPSFSFFLALGLLVLHFLPEPTYVQYFSTVFPFFLLAVFESLQSVFREKSVAALSLGAFIFLLSLSHFSIDVIRYTQTGKGVLGIPSEKLAEERKLSFLRTVSRELNAALPSGAQVAPLWPGYLIGTHLVASPGFENHFTFRAGGQLGEEARGKFHVLRLDEVLSMIQKGQLSYVLGWKRDFRGPLIRELNKNGYKVMHEWGAVQLRGQSSEVLSEK